ncbi:hypothetical protein BMS_1875 [Halobacteriovorax marinus SJ]|uniref:Uncharacterized protein n=1 Tax=Halobacteriovorax marinus (strain ATCC BAA-682 / DSM 15412 / SJ) TaxID=862908 RepID=E1X235_HALMS|nr:2Fe-2S iron-sulfur cluster-binding protein [Halobacteriovorax marinus]CBW26695.1 hypothetical protein BMS_1875 [Halobacteriovorax marinus SJ]
MLTVVIYGEASKKVIKEISLHEDDLSKTILELLQDHKIPIASSCMGEGVCKKCVINDNILSCFKLVKDITKWESPIIRISYL